MATKGNSGGLLSKMARFVRHPTTDWSELDKPPVETDGGYSKEALKDMIERKRQNDFVRRMEFDHLRKLRRNGPPSNPDQAGRPSFFQSSMNSNLDERATTLKKIDEIEAQMSKQWWKGRQDDATVQGDMATGPGGPSSLAGLDQLAPAPSADENGFTSTQGPAAVKGSDLPQDADDLPTQMGLVDVNEAKPTADASMTAAAAFDHTINQGFDVGVSGFSTSKLVSFDLGEGMADPDLEEAAIRFANGDVAGAEAGLLAALQAEPPAPDLADGWATALFDLYRATGQQASFDRVAIDYATRFGRSAPGWFSTPELLGQKAAAPGGASAALPPQRGQTVWDCPAELDLPAVQAMQASLTHATVPWHLNWLRLDAMTPEAAQALAKLFAEWCTQHVQLRFSGADVLERSLRNATPSGDRQVAPYWWALRLDALRILRLQDEFELAALDYCVTYEVSPPPWEEPQCEYDRSEQDLDDFLSLGENAATLHADGTADLPGESDIAVPTVPAPDAATVPVVALTGEVLGDAAEALDRLQQGLKGADRIVISCDRLIRVDFSAAGSILNWVAAREAEGCQVQFREVPCLVAAFFSVIGICEHAKVILRNN